MSTDREALRFYADPENWREIETGIGMQPSVAEMDNGRRAYAALARPAEGELKKRTIVAVSEGVGSGWTVVCDDGTVWTLLNYHDKEWTQLPSFPLEARAMVRIPTSAEEATTMVLLGTNYLNTAPEEPEEIAAALIRQASDVLAGGRSGRLCPELEQLADDLS